MTFWAGPICGAIAAGGLWWALFVKKQKKKGRSKKTNPTSPAVGTPAREGGISTLRLIFSGKLRGLQVVRLVVERQSVHPKP